MTLRIMHVAQPVVAGVAVCVEHYVRVQRAAGLSVAVASPGEPLAGGVARYGAQPLQWAAQRAPGLSIRTETADLARLVREWRPDVLHLHSAKAGLAGRLAVRGRLPVVYQPHAWSFDAVTGPVRRATLAWERYAARWTSMLLCVSDAEAERGRMHGIRGRYAVVPNGVDLAAFPYAGPAERAAARATLGLGPGPLAVCLGRLARQKGQDLLVAAWPAARRAVPDATLALVGDGPAAAALRAQAGPGVVFPGPTAEPARWLAAADVVVVPSRWEGAALVPLEAMASGRSVVVSDVTGNAETVAAGTGAVVGHDDLPALAEAVARRLADPALAEAEGRAGRRHAQHRYDIDITAARVLPIYDEAVGGAAALRCPSAGGEPAGR